MLTHAGPKVLEFNCRFGDPETQVLMARFQGDLLDLLWRTATGTLADATFSFDKRSACCVVVCSKGYPGATKSGYRISGLRPLSNAEAAADEPLYFQAGTSLSTDKSILTAGGRVVGATALGENLAAAAKAATAAAAMVKFDGAFFRRDIGYRVLSVQTAR